MATIFVNLAGVALGGLVGFFSARHISTLTSHRQACAAFRAALAPVCVELRKATEPSNSLDDALQVTLSDVAMAFENFYPFVPNNKRISYEKAWREYEEAAELGSEFMYTDNRLAEVNRRVNNLRKYGKQP